MRWIGLGALVLSTCSLAACGGSTMTGNTGTAGSGGASGGAGGAVGGCMCEAGYQCQQVNGSYECVPYPSNGGGPGTAGSGGTAGSAGSGGSGGTPPSTACSAAVQASSGFNAQVGFGSSNASGSAKVTQVSATSLELASPGATLEFKWVGPDLTGHFTSGEPVTIGRKDGWSYVVGLTNIAAVRQDVGATTPQIPAVPMMAGPHLAYAAQCSYTDATGACGNPPGTVEFFTIDATTGAGVVSAGQGQTIQFMDWQIHNNGSVELPAYTGSNCDSESGFHSVVTVLGPSPVNGGP